MNPPRKYILRFRSCPRRVAVKNSQTMGAFDVPCSANRAANSSLVASLFTLKSSSARQTRQQICKLTCLSHRAKMDATRSQLRILSHAEARLRTHRGAAGAAGNGSGVEHRAYTVRSYPDDFPTHIVIYPSASPVRSTEDT